MGIFSITNVILETRSAKRKVAQIMQEDICSTCNALTDIGKLLDDKLPVYYARRIASGMFTNNIYISTAQISNLMGANKGRKVEESRI